MREAEMGFSCQNHSLNQSSAPNNKLYSASVTSNNFSQGCLMFLRDYWKS